MEIPAVFTTRDSSSRLLQLWILSEASLVVERPRKLAWEIDLIVDNFFQVYLRYSGIGKEYDQGRFVFV